MLEVNLNSLNRGSVGYVKQVAGNYAVKQHMYNAGFSLGTKIVVLNISPYIGSFLLDVGGRVIAVRRGAVSLVSVTV